MFETMMESILLWGLSAGMSVVWAVVVLLIGLKVITVLRGLVRKAMERASIDTGVAQFLDALVKIAAYAVLILALLAHFGVQTTSFITILGSAGVAIGLSLQGSLSNFAGGILILILKPFVVGNYIVVGSVEGVVTEISIIYTTLHTLDNRNVVMPNGTLANTNIINCSANATRRVDMSVDVGYGSDLKKAREVIVDILNHEEKILKDPAWTVAVDSLGESGVNILVRPWVNAADYWEVKWRILETIHNRLAEENIEIPFKQVTVHMSEE